MLPKILELQTTWFVYAFISILAGFFLISPYILLLAAVFALLASIGKNPEFRLAGGILLIIAVLLVGPVYVVSFRQPREASSEALTLLIDLKTPVEAFYGEKKYCPTPEEVNAHFASVYVTHIVRSSLAHSTKCMYTATLKDNAHVSVGLAYLIERQTWSCKPADIGTTIAPAYLPFACRD
jgi:hypothetical protein